MSKEKVSGAEAPHKKHKIINTIATIITVLTMVLFALLGTSELVLLSSDESTLHQLCDSEHLDEDINRWECNSIITIIETQSEIYDRTNMIFYYSMSILCLVILLNSYRRS